MSDNHVGDLRKLTLTEVRNEADELADPTSIELKIKPPSGAEVTEVWPGGNIERASIGNFYCPLLLSEEGVWVYEWQLSGNIELVEPGEIVVEETLFDGDGEPWAVPWRPGTDDVAALISARTVLPGGQRVGDFTAETRPTSEQVERVINLAVRTVATQTSAEPCKAPLRADARAVAAYLAAALVEQSYWPEQSISAQSTYAGLMKIAEANLEKLEERVTAECGEGEGGEEGGGVAGAALPQGAFDDGVEVLGRTWPTSW